MRRLWKFSIAVFLAAKAPRFEIQNYVPSTFENARYEITVNPCKQLEDGKSCEYLQFAFYVLKSYSLEDGFMGIFASQGDLKKFEQLEKWALSIFVNYSNHGIAEAMRLLNSMFKRSDRIVKPGQGTVDNFLSCYETSSIGVNYGLSDDEEEECCVLDKSDLPTFSKAGEYLLRLMLEKGFERSCGILGVYCSLDPVFQEIVRLDFDAKSWFANSGVALPAVSEVVLRPEPSFSSKFSAGIHSFIIKHSCDKKTERPQAYKNLMRCLRIGKYKLVREVAEIVDCAPSTVSYHCAGFYFDKAEMAKNCYEAALNELRTLQAKDARDFSEIADYLTEKLQEYSAKPASIDSFITPLLGAK